ncbi:POC1 centriolar protein homolog, partial [Rhagoletis pomonella]|uniref:POC1 centriolar protein homolog n=1 Tax=Rhagoletis pomonella TaxID=28610 RepID=UPI001780ABBD
FTGHTNWVGAAKFSPNDQLIASCGDDKPLRICDTSSGEFVRSLTAERSMGRQLAWHPDGDLVALALSFNRIAESELIQLYKVQSAPVNDVAFHPMEICLLEGRPIYSLTGHTDKVCAVAFSSDGRHFASAGEDRQIR